MKTHTFAPPGTNLAPQLERNRRGRDLVVGDIHGHFATLRRALAELEVGDDDRVFSLGDLVDRGPDSFQAKEWMEGRDRSARFDLVVRGNHEQMMLEALVEGPPRRRRLWDDNAWSLWEMNGGRWWDARRPGHDAHAWIDVLCVLPFSATVETRHGPVGLVHAAPVHENWQDLEDGIRDEGRHGHLTRVRALWSRVRHGHVQREIGETGHEHMGPVEGVRCGRHRAHPGSRDRCGTRTCSESTPACTFTERGYGRLTIRADRHERRSRPGASSGRPEDARAEYGLKCERGKGEGALVEQGTLES